MTAERSPPTDDGQRVVPFRRRGAASGSGYGWRRWPAIGPQPTLPPDLAKFEGGGQEDDYRHRMLVNVAAVVFTIVLAGTGAWLAMTLADMRKNQDCYLSGRRNCTPIDPHAFEKK